MLTDEGVPEAFQSLYTRCKCCVELDKPDKDVPCASRDARSTVLQLRRVGNSTSTSSGKCKPVGAGEECTASIKIILFDCEQKAVRKCDRPQITLRI
jgi:hypothetical protein